MSNIQRHWVSLLALALAPSACAPATQEHDLGFNQPAAAEEPMIVVQNDYWGEMDIYAVKGGTRWRLGSVTTGSTAKLRIPHALMAGTEIQFQADPVGPVAPFAFPPISIPPGATVELTLENVLPMSSYAVVF